jgi:hypothetical protein
LQTSETKDDTSFELLDDPNVVAQQEHTKADRCGQYVKDDHDVLHFHPGKTCREFSASAGDLQPMKRRHPSSMDRSLETCSDPIRSAITVAGILGQACGTSRTCGSTASTREPRRGR